MRDEPAFIRLQRAFAAHLRDPEHVPAPGAHEPRRLAIYRHAVYANIDGFMRDNFPRVRAVLDDARWQALVRDYIIRHASWTGAFVELPREFLSYLEHERAAAGDPPFLTELAHFDWLETLVGADPRTLDFTGIVRDGDLLSGVPVANPTLRMVTYRYPVHVIDRDYQPAAPPAAPTRIAAFRAADNRYNFFDLSAAAARLLELILAGHGRRGSAILAQVATELGHAEPAALHAAGGTILARMLTRGALLGVRRG